MVYLMKSGRMTCGENHRISICQSHNKCLNKANFCKANCFLIGSCHKIEAGEGIDWTEKSGSSPEWDFLAFYQPWKPYPVFGNSSLPQNVAAVPPSTSRCLHHTTCTPGNWKLNSVKPASALPFNQLTGKHSQNWQRCREVNCPPKRQTSLSCICIKNLAP